jgi:hypothetical protein
VFECEHVEVRAERGDLDRQALHVGTPQPLAYGGEPRVGFVVTEDRLAEQVDVEVEAGGLAFRDVGREAGIGRGQDHAGGLGANAARDDGGDEVGCGGGADRGEPQAGAIKRTQRRRHPGLDECAQPCERATRVGGAQDFVGQREQQLASFGVGEEATKSLRAPAFRMTGVGERRAQELIGERDRGV